MSSKDSTESASKSNKRPRDEDEADMDGDGATDTANNSGGSDEPKPKKARISVPKSFGILQENPTLTRVPSAKIGEMSKSPEKQTSGGDGSSSPTATTPAAAAASSAPKNTFATAGLGGKKSLSALMAYSEMEEGGGGGEAAGGSGDAAGSATSGSGNGNNNKRAWEWQDDNGKWNDYDAETCAAIAAGDASGEHKIPLTVGFFATRPGYEVDLRVGVQRNIESGYVRAVREKEAKDEAASEEPAAATATTTATTTTATTTTTSSSSSGSSTMTAQTAVGTKDISSFFSGGSKAKAKPKQATISSFFKSSGGSGAGSSGGGGGGDDDDGDATDEDEAPEPLPMPGQGGLPPKRRAIVESTEAPVMEGLRVDGISQHVWEWQDDDHSWKNYEPATCALLNKALEDGEAEIALDTDWFATHENYIVDLQLMRQRNTVTGFERTVRFFLPKKTDTIQGDDFVPKVWQYMADTGDWTSYTEKDCQMIEMAFLNKQPSVVLTAGPVKKPYRVDFQAMVQRNVRSAKTRPIRRLD